MIIKKTCSVPFHLGNKLNGQKGSAVYGLFDNGNQIGVVHSWSGCWRVLAMDWKTDLVGYSVGSFKEVKELVAKKSESIANAAMSVIG